MTDEEKTNDIYDICLEKKSIYCNRKMGEETCNKCKTYQMYKLGLEEGRKEKEEFIGMFINVDLEKENAELKAQVEEIQNKVKQILLDNNAEIGQLREVVGLDWCDKDYAEELKKRKRKTKKRT